MPGFTVIGIPSFGEYKMPTFGNSSRNPGDLVRSLKEALLILDSNSSTPSEEVASEAGVLLCSAAVQTKNRDKHSGPPQVNFHQNRNKRQEKAREELSKQLLNIKDLLLESQSSTSTVVVGAVGGNGSSQSDIIVAQLSQEVYNSGVLLLLLRNLQSADFEGKKNTVQVFNNLLRRQIGTRTPTVEYICTKPEIVFTLCRGYQHQEIALHCGTMLRECVKYEPLGKLLLQSEQFYDFFKYADDSTFDIASDAFATFREILTKHKLLAAKFLEANFDIVFNEYHKLLHSENYVTRLQSTKLLGEILMDRHNVAVMTRYIVIPENLKLIMNLLKEKAKNIQFEAFHVFKVFVANPHKSKPVLDILLRNRDKLINFLPYLCNERVDDQLKTEKEFILKQIRELKPST